MKRDVPLSAFLVLLPALLFLAWIWLFDNVKIQSPAMEPAFRPGQYLAVWCGAYGLRLPLVGEVVRTGTPARGDVVLIQKEPGEEGGEEITAVLRVIGLPGEVVGITDKGVWIDGEEIDEPYATFSDGRIYPGTLSFRDNMAAVVVPDDAFFVMGDMRDITTDSRFFGTVTRDEILGKVVLIYW